MKDFWSHIGRLMRRSLRTSLAKVPLVAGIIAFAANTGAQASSSGSGYVTTIIYSGSGFAFVYQNGSRTARPACSVNDRWVIPITTAAGQSMLAGMMTAYATGKVITVNGTGACSEYADTESISYFSSTP
jgi:hypothetical protein